LSRGKGDARHARAIHGGERLENPGAVVNRDDFQHPHLFRVHDRGGHDRVGAIERDGLFGHRCGTGRLRERGGAANGQQNAGPNANENDADSHDLRGRAKSGKHHL
jgi:hypothetical protein